MKVLSATFVRTVADRGGNPLGLALRSLFRAIKRDRTLRRLYDLDDRMLRDIGLSRDDVERSRRQW